MRTLALMLFVPAGLAYAQATTTMAPAAAPAPATEKTVEQTASPDIVGQMVSELAITPNQAEGAAGALFGQAKSKLSVDDFAKVAAAVPNMEGLLKAAPAATKGSATDILAATGASALGAAAATASTLSKLGIKPETIVKVAPTLVKIVQTKGGAQVGALLAGALK
jgi:Protein of unknown function VcgC/VcgE (DUF2780)